MQGQQQKKYSFLDIFPNSAPPYLTAFAEGAFGVMGHHPREVT